MNVRSLRALYTKSTTFRYALPWIVYGFVGYLRVNEVEGLDSAPHFPRIWRLHHPYVVYIRTPNFVNGVNRDPGC